MKLDYTGRSPRQFRIPRFGAHFVASMALIQIGCNKMPPECGSQEVLSTMKELEAQAISDELKAKGLSFSPDPRRITASFIATEGIDEKLYRRTCSAQVSYSLSDEARGLTALGRGNSPNPRLMAAVKNYVTSFDLNKAGVRSAVPGLAQIRTSVNLLRLSKERQDAGTGETTDHELDSALTEPEIAGGLYFEYFTLVLSVPEHLERLGGMKENAISLSPGKTQFTVRRNEDNQSKTGYITEIEVPKDAAAVIGGYEFLSIFGSAKPATGSPSDQSKARGNSHCFEESKKDAVTLRGTLEKQNAYGAWWLFVPEEPFCLTAAGGEHAETPNQIASIKRAQIIPDGESEFRREVSSQSSVGGVVAKGQLDQRISGGEEPILFFVTSLTDSTGRSLLMDGNEAKAIERRALASISMPNSYRVAMVVDEKRKSLEFVAEDETSGQKLEPSARWVSTSFNAPKDLMHFGCRDSYKIANIKGTDGAEPELAIEEGHIYRIGFSCLSATK